jgi:hypothetical protein
MSNKRAKFVRLAEARVTKTIKNLRLIGNLANRTSYEYTDADVRKIFLTLDRELKMAKERFQSPSSNDSGFEFKL